MSDNETFDLPGVGELRSRRGTSTAELAGMAAFWHKRSIKSWRDGFFTASVMWFTLGFITLVSYHYFG